jgi:hypothetical protein
MNSKKEKRKRKLDIILARNEENNNLFWLVKLPIAPPTLDELVSL